MMKKIFLLVLAAMLFLPLFAQNKVITIAGDPWPPFLDPENPTNGLSVEIVNAAFETQGYETEIKYMPWARAINGVKEGDYDILVNAWMTEERKEFLMFSDPYTANQIKFIKRAGSDFEFTQMSDLDGLTIGVIRGYGYGDKFMKYEYFTRDESADFETNVKKLIAGRFDLTLEDEIVARIKIAKENRLWFEEIEFVKNPLSQENLYVACGLKNARHQEIIEAFNKGLEVIKTNGTYAKIMEKYGIKQ